MIIQEMGSNSKTQEIVLLKNGGFFQSFFSESHFDVSKLNSVNPIFQ